MHPFQRWTVLPHGSLEPIGDDMLAVTGKMRMPFGESKRRMTVVRLQSGKLVIFSAIALHENEMRELERFGTPAFLIVPSDLHRMDAKTWKTRYPAMKVIAPEGARAKVEEVVKVDATRCDFGDPSVRFVTVAGTGGRESALVVERNGRTTLVVTDIVFNLPNIRGVRGWLFKTLGITGDAPHLPGVVKMARVKDASALAMQLEVWARTPNLSRIIVSHGDVVSSDATHVLEEIAHRLAA